MTVRWHIGNAQCIRCIISIKHRLHQHTHGHHVEHWLLFCFRIPLPASSARKTSRGGPKAMGPCKHTANSEDAPGSHHQNDSDLAVVMVAFVESGRGCKLSCHVFSLCNSTTSSLSISYSPQHKLTEASRDTTHSPAHSALCLLSVALPFRSRKIILDRTPIFSTNKPWLVQGYRVSKCAHGAASTPYTMPWQPCAH